MTETAEGDEGLLEAALARLRRRVEERTAAGDYPAGMLDELDAQYRSLAPARGAGDRLDQKLAALDRAADIGRHRIYTDSRVALGSAVHRAVGRVTVRQTSGVLGQVAEFAQAVREVLHAVVDLLPEDDLAALGGRVDYLLDRVAAYERAPAGSDAALRELSARLDAVEAAVRARQGAAHFSHSALEAARLTGAAGCAEEVRHALRAVAWKGPVLVVSSGAGDALRLLREAGVDAGGVEADAELARAAAGAGLPVTEADPVAHLEAVPESSLGGVVAVREVEALPPRGLAALVTAAARALRRDGHLVLAASPRPVLSAGTEWAAGVPVAFVRFLVEQVPFASVEVRRCAGGEHDDAVDTAGLDASAAAAVQRLRERVAALEAESSPYLVVATR